MNIYRFFRMEMNSGSILGYFLQALPAALAMGIVFFVIRFVLLKKRNRKISLLELVVQTVFVCYLTGLFSLVVLPANFWLNVFDGIFLGRWEKTEIFHFGEINLVPSLIKCLNGELSLGSWVKTMLVNNILMFVPFGFLFVMLNGCRNKRQILLTAVIFPLCLEVLQLFFGRSFDIDDLICNFAGILAGALIALAFHMNQQHK